jgi:LysM repeat protein
MNNNDPNPLVPQGSLQQASVKAKSNLRVAFFIVAIVHVALIGGILMVGCKKEEPAVDPAKQKEVTSTLPPLDPTYYPPAPATGTTAVATTDPLGIPPVPPVDTNAGMASPAGTAGVGTLPPPPGPDTMTTPVSDVPPPTPDASEYTIARGDTFYGIAQKHGVSMNAVSKANPGVDPTRLRPGQKIKVPAKTASVAAPAGNGGGAGNGTYTVKSGDNLSRIASRQGTTVAALKSANNLRTDRINVGQKLKIPGGGTRAAAPATETAPVAPPPADPFGGALPPVPPQGNL